MATVAKVLRYVAFSVTVLFGVVGGLFIVGETFIDPGGVRAALMSAAWVVPMVALAGFALWRPERAIMVLAFVAVLTATFVVLDGAFGMVPTQEVGPVGSISVFGVAVALGCLGLRRPVPAGWLLLLVGAANLTGVVAKIFERDGAPVREALGGSSGAVAVPVLAIGVLFLLAASFQPRPERATTDGRHPTHRARPAH